MNNKNIKWLGIIFTAVLISCATSPNNNRTPPLWVTDREAAFPNSEWLCVVESELDVRTAENAAISSLARVFRVDLNSVTTANRQLAEAMNKVRGRTTVTTSQSSDIAQELVSSSVVSGLIGLQVDSWANPRDGRVYANARMNRRESSARYSAMIRENENVIANLKAEAERNPAAFEAFELLNLAYNIALVTDNLHSLLTVLDPSAISRHPSYGNAETIRSLSRLAAQSIIVTIRVDGDINGRIAAAFSESLNTRGFRTNVAGNNPYILSASFRIDDVDFGDSRNVFVRYLLNYSLRNREGVEIFSNSENGREGHISRPEAVERAIRTAERSIGSTGFAASFDAFMASLL
jgi:hypothetical protein